MAEVYRFETEVGGRKLSVEAGRLAEQADGAVLIQYGDTVMLATVVGAHQPRPGVDFFPLTVEYQEKMYAAGKFPGGFIKRENRPSDNAILIDRLTDRPLRPLFPKGYGNDVQIINTVLSIDNENEPEILSIIGSSAALCISDIPFQGPVGAAKVGFLNNDFILNPTREEMERSLLDLSVAGTETAVLMVEAGAHELSEELMLEAVKFGHAGLQSSIQLQKQLIEACARPKREFTPPAKDTSFEEEIKGWMGSKLTEAVNNPVKQNREAATDAVKAAVVEQFTQGVAEADLPAKMKQIESAWYNILKEEVRSAILDRDSRPDGRSHAEIRPISTEVGVLPRTHGSGLFTRGQTQVLSITTLGTSDDEQSVDGLGPETSKRYVHQYNFPPFSTGETKMVRGASRRDIGHGHLAERSLIPVLPNEETFPYAIRVVSEVLSSNGSSSMGSVCGSSLSLMDAGVPISAPVAGVAMGLVTSKDGSKHQVLTDIQGIEDSLGDMDFKVAGTEKGVTGLQMDIKTLGLSYEIMEEAFAQARDGRIFILGKMAETITQPRADISLYAPRIIAIKINPEKIGALIGPGGKNIRSITEDTGCKIDIEEDGTVRIASTDGEAAKRAIARIEAVTKEVEVGQVYLGKVVRIMPYGAFVQILPGKDGMVHVSELADYDVRNVEDVVSMGDEINVMVTDIDRMGKVSLSRRAVLTGQMPAPRAERSGGGDRGPRPGGGGGFSGGGDRGPRPSGDRPGWGGGNGSGSGDRGPRR